MPPVRSTNSVTLSWGTNDAFPEKNAQNCKVGLRMKQYKYYLVKHSLRCTGSCNQRRIKQKQQSADIVAVVVVV